jgi:hypothetical protein
MENNSFVDNLRKALNSYNGGQKSDLMKQLEKEWSAEMVRKNGARATADLLLGSAAANGYGALASGNPATLGAGAGISGVLALIANSALTSSEKYHTAERKRILDEKQREATNQWTDFKNEAIKKASKGKYDVTALAKQGKMVDDDGNIIDIDYDYYQTVPYQTLERVFGAEGAEAVRNHGRPNIIY